MAEPAKIALAQSDEQIERDDSAQKSVDLSRARANHDISPDRLVVVYQRATGVSDPERLVARQRSGGQVLQASRGLQRDVLRVANGAAESMARIIRRLPGVKDAYPDRIAHATLQVNDPLLSMQWGVATMYVPQAWDVSLGAGVPVAVLDCGIHSGHPDLLGKVSLEQNFTAEASTDDLCNHGTHVAGIIAANTNNGIGVAGVAPGARLLNAKVLGDTGSGYFSDIERGIQWAADNGARVINMSLGADGACIASTQTAVDYAWNRGTVVVAAAGNSGLATGASMPGNCNNVIAVAATDSADLKASFSNSGSSVQIAAPGLNVLSTLNPDVNAGSQYGGLSGTSMAAPNVAAVAALVAATTYATSAAAIRDRLFSTADPIAGTGVLWTYGRVNAAAAVGNGGVSGGSPTPTSTPSPTLTPTTTPTASTTPTPIAGSQTVGFDDLTRPDRVLNSQYPNGLIDWGSNSWWLASPWGQFKTNSISFNGPSATSANFTFVTPQRVVQIDAFNGGIVSSTVSLSCAGQPTAQITLAANQMGTLITDWSGTCSVVSVVSSNGWDTNFDSLVVASGNVTVTPSPTSTPTLAPTSTATATLTPVPTDRPAPTATPTPPAATTPTATSTSTPTATRTPAPTDTPVPTGCPCTLFPSAATPSNLTSTDTHAVELGVKFTADQSGFIAGIRFYKAPTNTGTHVGSLWSSTGTLLAQAAFVGETASGWQQINFSSAVAVTANTTYIASYHTNVGHYSGDLNYFATAANAGLLHAPSSGTSGGNGVYAYAANSAFPTNSYQASNYWVDVMFNPSQPASPTPTNTPTTGPSSTPTASPTATVGPTSTATATATATPGVTGTLTPAACPCSLFGANAAPSNPAGGSDPNPVELGVKFRSDQAGFVSAIRFYKAPNNTGTHVVNLWSSNGTLLATAIATGETASGWQQVSLPSQVAITANTTYVVSYHTSTGHYGADLNYFTATLSNGGLQAPSSAAIGGNGVYVYGAVSAFPTHTYNSANYWVDVVYHP
jgi:subtilisin family serine protease